MDNANIGARADNFANTDAVIARGETETTAGGEGVGKGAPSAAAAAGSNQTNGTKQTNGAKESNGAKHTNEATTSNESKPASSAGPAPEANDQGCYFPPPPEIPTLLDACGLRFDFNDGFRVH